MDAMTQDSAEAKQLPQNAEQHLRHLLETCTYLRAAVDNGVKYVHLTTCFWGRVTQTRVSVSSPTST